MAENKIKYGLSKLAYAVAAIASDNTATYGTPVDLPGAVSISLSPQGEKNDFYADNIKYWVGNSNTGYEGDLEVARLTEAFKKDILGFVVDNKGNLLEDVNAPAVHFALLFQFEGDAKATRHVIYNCTATRSDTASNTKTENIEPQTESVTISAGAIHVAALGANGMDIVKAESADATDSTTYNGWFSTVYVPAGLSA